MEGGTVRSEFEVLTGLSTDYLPVGEIPNNNILKNSQLKVWLIYYMIMGMEQMLYIIMKEIFIIETQCILT